MLYDGFDSSLLRNSRENSISFILPELNIYVA